jgi:hypothetical protein
MITASPKATFTAAHAADPYTTYKQLNVSHHKRKDTCKSSPVSVPVPSGVLLEHCN